MPTQVSFVLSFLPPSYHIDGLCQPARFIAQHIVYIKMSFAGETQEARDLLAALANFVKPFVYECVESETIRNEARKNESSPEEPIEKQLVTHLKAYIAKTVDDCRAVAPSPLSSSANLSSNPRSTALGPCSYEIAARNYTHNSFEMNILRGIFLDECHSAVSKFPARLLAFHEDGSSIRLVSSHEVIHIWTEQIWRPIIDRLEEDEASGLLVPARFYELQLDIKDFISKRCRYTILSHTWSKDLHGEISYHDWSTRMQHPTAFAKISNFCRVSAQEHDCYFAWIDTCCINKESSAELDEAIRSMYKWYSQAPVCVIYLAETETVEDIANDSWFTRGWTLQELVAPQNQVFVYNRHWEALECDQNTVLGSAAKISPAEMVYFRTGKKENIPLSRRLQMAGDRRVTREEDTAYSLMGILDVSISIAYGEGSCRAFSRLMNEIINTRRNILDIFNRGYSEDSTTAVPESIALYRRRSNLFDNGYQLSIIPSEPLLLTHLGLRMSLLLIPGVDWSAKEGRHPEYIQPIGNLYGQLDDSLLLDRQAYSGRIDSFWIKLFGIVNFSNIRGKITIMNPCLAIPLKWNASDKIGSIQDISVAFENDPPVFTLKSLTEAHSSKSEITLSENELEYNGLQLITAYL